MVSTTLMMTTGVDPPPRPIKAPRSHKKPKIPVISASATAESTYASPHATALEDGTSNSLFVDEESTALATVPMSALITSSRASETIETTAASPVAESGAVTTTEITHPIASPYTTESDSVTTAGVTHPPAVAFDGENEDAAVLDPATSERQYCCDPFKAHNRGIWRPGDGDGDQSTDYHDRIGPALPLEQRWRLYQSDGGNVSKMNMPPKHVLLDDRAAWEILKSDIARRVILVFWPHDFAGTGTIRHRRPHRGRAAIRDPNAVGDLKFHFALHGHRKERYYFTGAKDYKPVIYRIELPPAPGPAEAEPNNKRKASPARTEPENPRKHGHNQHTPKELMVKHGAPSKNKGRLRYRERLNTFLRKDPKPDYRGLYGTAGYFYRKAKAAKALEDGESSTADASQAPEGMNAGGGGEDEGGMWVAQNESGRVLGEVLEEFQDEHRRGDTSTSFENVGLSGDDEEQVHEATSSARKSLRHSSSPAENAEVSEDEAGSSNRHDSAHSTNLLDQAADADHEGGKQARDSSSYTLQLEEQVRKAQRQIQALTDSLTAAQGKSKDSETVPTAL
ncbi:hypothetical protein LTR91_021130 [Friedmanniomyces endolithicus]|uniref:Uncharacterized protein n=1 Tax=Friedmanniomyces endolithicus TaxID=329885 RepID=A0AAN6K0F1_9PEZI|nr:hypothetical protein LTR94_008501 [Friedmanniomyces endolithicus]KAK0808913.1 hypothetical protein LTR38_004389 [Friedmanniomyces endolithicus]KAK0809636.1 hypothetical protein LTR59_002497 [Friedmanniomyces endolithicus]KAK0819475.1 hypothetical protein LTR75_001997 [Friedmanniomyces endolithicus]KAK0844939.1 hypothetical protein LTR03_007789 [Friedmanniomyces endolithicus]